MQVGWSMQQHSKSATNYLLWQQTELERILEKHHRIASSLQLILYSLWNEVNLQVRPFTGEQFKPIQRIVLISQFVKDKRSAHSSAHGIQIAIYFIFQFWTGSPIVIAWQKFELFTYLETVILVSVSSLIFLITLPSFPMIRPQNLSSANIFNVMSLQEQDTFCDVGKECIVWIVTSKAQTPTPSPSGNSNNV